MTASLNVSSPRFLTLAIELNKLFACLNVRPRSIASSTPALPKALNVEVRIPVTMPLVSAAPRARSWISSSVRPSSCCFLRSARPTLPYAPAADLVAAGINDAVVVPILVARRLLYPLIAANAPSPEIVFVDSLTSP